MLLVKVLLNESNTDHLVFFDKDYKESLSKLVNIVSNNRNISDIKLYEVKMCEIGGIEVAEEKESGKKVSNSQVYVCEWGNAKYVLDLGKLVNLLLSKFTLVVYAPEHFNSALVKIVSDESSQVIVAYNIDRLFVVDYTIDRVLVCNVPHYKIWVYILEQLSKSKGFNKVEFDNIVHSVIYSSNEVDSLIISKEIVK